MPTSVSMPVATTMARPRPLVTTVPDQTMLARAVSAVFSGTTQSSSLGTGCDSPVSTDSSVSRLYTSMSLASAAILSPGDRTSTSPGTTSAASIDCAWPPRSTRAWGADSSARAARARSARNSCTKPRMAFTTTMASMAAASLYSPITADAAVAPSSTRTMKSWNCDARMARGDMPRPVVMVFGPASAKRARASPESRPDDADVPSSRATAPRDIECQ